MHPAVPISLVFIGCCSNVVFLEYLISDFPTSGNLITFLQFAFIALEGLVFTSKFGTVKSKIPVSVYGIMVSLFFMVQVANNAAYGFNISMPLQMIFRAVSICLVNYMTPSTLLIFFFSHYGVMVTFFFVVQVANNYSLSFNVSLPLQMIFRAGSLIANLTLGMIIMKKRYNVGKYLSVMLITAGIIVCTIASAQQVDEKNENSTGNKLFDLTMWLLGILILSGALFLTAGMGIYQEKIYAKYGKHPKESLFFNHALPLPGFLLLSTDIYKHIQMFNKTAPLEIALGFTLPRMWFFLILNVISQYICISSVFVLTTECTSLTVTLVVTLRKFVSLIFSIWYFKNPFTIAHWCGTAMVFLGTLMFTEVLPIDKVLPKKKKAD